MLAAAIYVGLVVFLLFVMVTSVVDVVGQRGEVAEASTMLEQLEGRRPAALGIINTVTKQVNRNLTMITSINYDQRHEEVRHKRTHHPLGSGLPFVSGIIAMAMTPTMPQPIMYQAGDSGSWLTPISQASTNCVVPPKTVTAKA